MKNANLIRPPPQPQLCRPFVQWTLSADQHLPLYLATVANRTTKLCGFECPSDGVVLVGQLPTTATIHRRRLLTRLQIVVSFLWPPPVSLAQPAPTTSIWGWNYLDIFVKPPPHRQWSSVVATTVANKDQSSSSSPTTSTVREATNLMHLNFN